MAELPIVRGIRQQMHWHENPQYRFAATPDLTNDPTWRRGLAELEKRDMLFELQIFSHQMADGAALAKAFPGITFVLEHAGMLEDTSPEGEQKWRAGMAALASCSNVSVKLSGLGTFERKYELESIGPIVSETISMFGAERCMFGSNFPIEKLWTDYSTLYRTFRSAIEDLPLSDQKMLLHDAASRIYRL